MNSKAVPISAHIKSRLFFYLVTGFLSGCMLWLVEGIERTFSLSHNFVQPGENKIFWLYFVFTALGGPLWGLFLGLTSSLRLFGFQFISGEAPNRIGKFEIPGHWRQRVLGMAAVFAFFGVLAVLFPAYFSDPLYGMFAGATEKMWAFRLVFGHRKISTALILAGLTFLFCVLDELATTYLLPDSQQATSPKWSHRFAKLLNPQIVYPVFSLAGLWLLVVSYFADANIMVTRRDLSFHVPMYLTALTSSLILSAILYRLVIITRFGGVVIGVLAVAVAGASAFAVQQYEANQNLKSLFWRRGVVAKRYVNFARSLTNGEQKDFTSVIAKTIPPPVQPDQHDLIPVPPVSAAEKKDQTGSGAAASQSIKQTLTSALSTATTALGGSVTTQPSTVASGPRNVIFLSIDTLRADHMSIYGYKRHTTPNLDRFAKQSIFCEHGYSSGTNTGHSFSSIMRSAQGDGIFDNSVPTVAKLFADKGYQTAFITSPKTKTWLYKGRWFEYKQIMMESYQEITHEEARFWKADEMTDRSIDLLKRMKDKGPFFAWIHYTDPHAPYEAHAECGYGETDPDIYDSEITFTDLHIGRLLSYLQESGLLNNTLIAFTSDHGEGFNEHGALEHGCLPYIEQVFVPFWIYAPGAEPNRLTMPVSHVDIAPTMLAYAGITPPNQYEGIDIVKLARGEVAAHPHIICETPRNIPEGTFFAWSLIEGEWKIIYDRVGSNWQLYHLKQDPMEQRNLADLEPQKFSDLKQKLGQYLAKQAGRKDYSNWRRFEFRFGS